MTQNFNKDPTENLKHPVSTPIKNCKHGPILYGTKCLNCQRDERKDMLLDFDKLERLEQRAFLGWFAGGKTRLKQYQNEKDSVNFGKYECEQVSFNDFWLGKLKTLGWITVEEVRRYIAIGHVDRPEVIEFKILSTDKGREVREAYWNR